jgi:myo-inositol-1(or 4)-monophosphatase
MNHLETAIEIAQEAGALLATYFERRIGYELKGAFDLVTDADRASEKLVVERLRAAFPDHNIVAEEGGGHQSPSEYRWFVDPLDGTTNFAHGYPMFNVSIGLQRGEETVAGVVYDPMRRETFSAERSAGTYLNGSRVHVSKVSEIPRCLGVTGFPSPKRTNDINIHFWYQIAMASHGVRRSGSAALDLAWLSAGRVDLFWEFGLKPWDMAAGTILVEEAGGRVSDMSGARHSITKSAHLLADNGLLHEEALRFMARVFEGDFAIPLPDIK